MMANNEKHLSKLLRVLTNSERSEFACQRRWWFRYHQGLTTLDSAAPLRVGSLWHAVLAAWYQSGMTATHAQINQAVIEPWLEQRLFFLERQSTAEAPMDADEDREHAELVRGMLTGYLDTFTEHDAGMEILAVEPQVARYLTHPETGKPIRDRVPINGKKQFRRWAYGGAMDALVRLQDGTVWMMEHKTTTESDMSSYVRKLDWDPQIRGYAWAAANPIPVDGAISEPVRITGVIYNVARKKVPKEPEPLQRGGLSKAKGIDTTRECYMRAIQRNGLNPDHYADILEQLKNKTFFHREPYVFTDREMDDFAKDASHHALEVKRASSAAYHPRQTRICIGGIVPAPCPYKQICIEDGPMARKAFRVMGIRHAELTGDLAEPYVANLRPVTAPTNNAVPEKTALERALEASMDAINGSPATPATSPLHIVDDVGTVDPFA